MRGTGCRGRAGRGCRSLAAAGEGRRRRRSDAAGAGGAGGARPGPSAGWGCCRGSVIPGDGSAAGRAGGRGLVLVWSRRRRNDRLRLSDAWVYSGDPSPFAFAGRRGLLHCAVCAYGPKMLKIVCS